MRRAPRFSSSFLGSAESPHVAIAVEDVIARQFRCFSRFWQIVLHFRPAETRCCAGSSTPLARGDPNPAQGRGACSRLYSDPLRTRSGVI
jgi:hypothetical protein